MIKTWILVGLVGISLVFTWYLWFGSKLVFSPLPQARESGPVGSQGLTGTMPNDIAPNTGWRLWASAEGLPNDSTSLTSGGPNATAPGSGGLGEGVGESGVENGQDVPRGVESVARLTPAKALSPFQLLIRVHGGKQYLLTYGSQEFGEVYDDGRFFRDIGLQCPVPAALADVSPNSQALRSVANEPAKGGAGQGVDGGGPKTNALTSAELEYLRGVGGIELIFMRPIPLDQFFKAVGYDLSGPEWAKEARRILIAREPPPAVRAPSSTKEDLRGKGHKGGEGTEKRENRESEESAEGRESQKNVENENAVGVWAEVVRGTQEVMRGGDYVRLPMRVEEVRFKRVLKKKYPVSLLAEEVEPLPSPILQIPSGLYVLESPPRTGPLSITWETPAPKVLESMLRSFFIDLSVLRQIEEKDGAVIYTDGRRGLRVYPYGKIEYTAPSQSVSQAPTPSQERPALLDALSLSVEFVNSHGGWLPNSLLWDFGEQTIGAARTQSPQGLRMAFSAAVGTMPVFFGHNGEPLIEVVVSEEGISWYERRVPSPGTEPRGRMHTLRAQEALRSLVEHWKVTKGATGEDSGQAVRVEGIYLGYFGLPNGESSEFLYPAWFVNLGDGSAIAVNANTGMVFEPAESLRHPQ